MGTGFRLKGGKIGCCPQGQRQAAAIALRAACSGIVNKKIHTHSRLATTVANADIYTLGPWNNEVAIKGVTDSWSTGYSCAAVPSLVLAIGCRYSKTVLGSHSTITKGGTVLHLTRPKFCKLHPTSPVTADRPSD